MKKYLIKWWSDFDHEYRYKEVETTDDPWEHYEKYLKKDEHSWPSIQVMTEVFPRKNFVIRTATSSQIVSVLEDLEASIPRWSESCSAVSSRMGQA